VTLAWIATVALAARLLALPGSTEGNMDPDSAHLLNVARCFERGQGFSNPGGWPAWMKPARLPMPETFKEPAYSYAIARLRPLIGSPFRTGVLISLLAGLLTPFALYALARHLGLGRDVAGLAGLIAAANPLLIAMSVRVMVDSLFPAMLTLAFALAARPPGDVRRERPWWLEVLTGACVGIAFMVRAQTLVALPAFAVLLLARRPFGAAARGALVAAGAAILTASPFLIRNLRLFGAPFHSDVGAFGIWPYVDHLAFSNGLDRPPAPLAFALAHAPAVLRHMAESLVRFAIHTLPEHVAGNPVWVLPCAAGLVLSIPRWRAFLFAWLYLGATLTFIFAINWDARYFTSAVPLFALFTALGCAWLGRAIAPLPLIGRLTARPLLVAAVLVTFGIQAGAARREVSRFMPPEIEAAQAEAPFLRAHLKPDESAMVMTTSFYSWFADRPTVHLVIADDARFMETVSRLRVRAAILPISRLAEFAERYPDRRLPRALVLDHLDRARDAAVFLVSPAAAGP
jgi:hypothetical protein